MVLRWDLNNLKHRIQQLGKNILHHSFFESILLVGKYLLDINSCNCHLLLVMLLISLHLHNITEINTYRHTSVSIYYNDFFYVVRITVLTVLPKWLEHTWVGSAADGRTIDLTTQTYTIDMFTTTIVSTLTQTL